MIDFLSNKTVAIGEAMIEMAVVGDEHYRRNFAGDTFNTVWHMAQIIGEQADIGYISAVGTDALSDIFISQLQQDGIDTSGIRRIADRNMGLYLIELNDAERNFHYWRNHSAARLLADDTDWLDHALSGVGLIHFSGITLAILAPDARSRLLDALKKASANGAVISFDPNIRHKLWSSADEIRDTISAFLEITDIAVPSFDDEVSLWGDASSQETIKRFNAAGVQEIVVKNGAGAITALSQEKIITVDTPRVQNICDTSGAGDAFNSGYLAARLKGHDAVSAIGFGQQISAEVIQHFGARIPKTSVPKMK